LSQRELEDFVVDIAENRLVSYSRYQRLSGRVDDPEIHFISDYLRRNFRHTDKRQYTITYSELDAILRNFGYCLRNQQRGFIDVCRIEESRGFLGLGRTRTVYTKVSTIAFQGWRRTVSK